MRQDTLLGVAAMMIAPKEDDGFRTNLAIVVQNRAAPIELKEFADQSTKQLILLFNHYEPLATVSTELGPLEAIEIRGRYLAPDGNRIVRTLLAKQNQTRYVLTFSVREDREERFINTFEGMRKSFIPAQ